MPLETPPHPFYSGASLLLFDTPVGLQVPDRILVPALLFYEGEHVSDDGGKKSYSATQIKAIATATNKRLGKGLRTKLFADHSYQQQKVLGYLDGEVTAKPITEDLLPHPGMSELLGKLGIFGNVAIAGLENVQAYTDGRVRELSVGIDPTGKFSGVKNAIYEISAVSFPALAGARLYASAEDLSEGDFVSWGSSGGNARGQIESIATEGTIEPSPNGEPMQGSEEEPAIAVRVWNEGEEGWSQSDVVTVHRDEALTVIDPLDQAGGNYPKGKGKKPPAPFEMGMDKDKKKAVKMSADESAIADVQTHGVTLSESISDQQSYRLDQAVTEVLMAFTATLESIRRASPESLQGKTSQDLQAQAIADLARQLRGMLGVTDTSILPPVPLFQKEDIMTQENQSPTEQGTEPQTIPPTATEQFSAVELKLQVEQMKAQMEQFQAQAAEAERQKAIANQHTKLYRKAEILMQAGTITPAGFKNLFGTADDNSVDIFSAHQDSGKSNIEFLLEYLEQYGTRGIQYGMPITQPLSDRAPEGADDGGLDLAELFLKGEKLPA